jgi:Tfp pilus assembly protein PilF
MKFKLIPKLGSYPSSINMMKTRTLLCVVILAMGTIITLDFTGVMAQDSSQSKKSTLKMVSVSTTSNKAKAYVVSGNAKLDRKDYSGALGDYNRALSIDPNYVDAYINRASVKIRVGLQDSAIEDYQIAIKIDPNNADIYNDIGNALIVNHSSSKAIGYLNRALEIDPKHALAYANRGDARFNLQDYAGAVADYNRSLALDPNNPKLATVRGNRATAIGKIQELETLQHINRVRNAGGFRR